jgi:phage-related minor tail protein
MLSNFVLGGKIAGEDFKNSVLQSLVQLGTEAAASGIFQLLGSLVQGGGASGGGGGAGGFLKSLLGFIVPFADGGVVTRPRIGLVGEAGPEAIIPRDRMRGMGGITVNITNAVPGAEVRARRTPSGDLDIQVERSVRRTVGRGGSRDVFGGKHAPGAA